MKIAPMRGPQVEEPDADPWVLGDGLGVGPRAAGRWPALRRTAPETSRAGEPIPDHIPTSYRVATARVRAMSAVIEDVGQACRITRSGRGFHYAAYPVLRH